MEYRPTRDCEQRVERYADLADEARSAHRVDDADQFLLLAWAAYDDLDGELTQHDPQQDPRATTRRWGRA